MTARIGVAAAALVAAAGIVPGTTVMETRAASRPLPLQVVEGCDARPKRAKLDFRLKDLSGTAVKLADFKGKVIVLNFWATWCAPCKTEIPDFVELQARYGGAGLQMIGISADDTVKQLQPFVAAMKMNYPVLQGRGNDAILEAYAVASLPVTVIIGRSGDTCTKYSAPVAKELLERRIKSLL